MAGKLSLKSVLVAAYTFGLSQVGAFPAAASVEGVSELGSPYSNLQSRQQSPFIVTGVRDGVTQGQVPVRKDIREMMKNRTEFELFLLALQRFYSLPQSSDLSYYAVSGVHGRPYKAWAAVPNGRGANPNTGYCTHGDLLFLPWHRPYLAIYEQFIWNNAREVVNQFPDSDPRKAAFRTALSGLRIPYWDWASDSSVPAEVGSMKTIEVANPQVAGARQSIANPLYSYKFTDLSELPGAPFNRMPETYRYARIVSGRYESQPTVLNNAMTGIGGSLRNRVYQMLTAQAYKDFNLAGTKVTNHPGQFDDSFEGIHDTIHGTVGGGNIAGHMGQVPYAAFDPIFWLHHTNVDRLFAIWQGINPNSMAFNGFSGSGTFALAPQTAENLDTPLPPFRQSNTAYFSSRSAVRTSTFGYAYPETLASEMGSASPADVMASVNRIYGFRVPAGVLRAAANINRRKRSLDERSTDDNNSQVQSSGRLNDPPAVGALVPVEHKIVDLETENYTEWTANIQVNSGAFNGSFSIHFFLGDSNVTDPALMPTEKSYIGTHSIFANPETANNMLVAGAIPLTSALLNKVVDKQVDSLLPESVVPYLLKNLRAKVTVGARIVDLTSVKDLAIKISAAIVTLPKTIQDAPQWGNFETKVNFIDVPAGKFLPVPATKH
ncbi:hypothetical protein H072_139 [Dactylellina haptotyla CBS 200.50]|uniref:tyrosinase n=1 Tax=Dactylellina haptotyla (strain CBS 200.50) TaxID=1284197 RepID=S8AXM2_DACHA|nr:hypothetical protein H072_139 [Dactylellina haptotyla CBS 200.50]